MISLFSIVSFAQSRKQYPEFTRKDSLHGYLSKERKCFDVRFYDVNVDVNPQNKCLQGYCAMTIQFVDNQQQIIQIDLSSKLKIDSLYLDGEKQDYSREYNAVFIPLKKQYSTNTDYIITCWYHGKPVTAKRPPWEPGMVWSKSSSGKPWFGVCAETLGSSCWMPCKDHLSDEPENGMRMTVSVPEGLTVVSNGLLQSHETKNKKEIWIWQTKYPINQYNMTFYCGDFVHFGEIYNGVEKSFPLDYYVLPEDLEKAKASFEQAKSVIAVYENLYGPYPWENECYKLVESPYEGMEHQTAIAYGNRFKNTLGFDYIIVHESAHEWWGNTVSVDDYAEIFIHEGFAMYSEFLYVEKMFGKELRDRYIQIWANTMKNIRPVVGPRDVNFWDYHDTDPYVKGAWMLHGLRYVMNNDSLFFDIIKNYNISRRNSIVTVKDFTDYVYNRSGVDYSWYFQQYLYDFRVPTLEFHWISKEDALEKGIDYSIDVNNKPLEDTNKYFSYAELKWTNVDSAFRLPVSYITCSTCEKHEDFVSPVIVKDSIEVDRIQVNTNGVVVRFAYPKAWTSQLFNDMCRAYYKLNIIEEKQKDNKK